MTGVIAGTTAFGGLAGLAATAAHATSSVTTTTVYGADRYQSAGISNGKAFPTGVSEVVLADGLPGHQGDALAASGYAGVNGYGVLLTDNTNTVPANTMTALKNLGVKTIQPVGGPAAISAAQLAQLSAAGYTVKPSLAGPTSLATMEAINDTIPPSSVGTSGTGSSGTGTLKTAILASVDENHLIDALSAAGLSYANKFPLITTESSSSTLSPQAQQVITALGIQKLIVVGGTASIPASQYNPDPSGVTSEDLVTGGVDRADTSYLLATDEVTNYGLGKTAMDLAAGATFVGNTTAVQNDGADALSSAPFAGTNKIPTLVTDGPTQLETTQGPVDFAKNEASTLTNINIMTGPANLPQSQVNQVVTAAGGSTTAPTQYAVAPAPSATPLTPTASTSSAPSQGVETYTVSGLPGGSTPVDIALFPCSGTPQSGNGPTNGAPQTSSTGAVTFTAPGGTTPVAGSAVGEGTTSANSAGNTHPTTAPATGATAYIATVNGVPTPGTTTEYVAPAATSVTFVLNSWSPDCAIPIVYTVPSGQSQTVGSTSPAPLLVNANGTPQTGYVVGEGQASAWQAPPAPATATAADVYVLSANPSNNTFQACSNVTLSSNCYTYSYGSSNAFYSDGLGITLASFGADLSGPSGAFLPNTSTAQSVAEDEVYVGGNYSTGAVTGYSPSGGSDFQFDAHGGSALGDVPAAASAVSASFNGCAVVNGSGTCVPGDVITWTPSVNQSMSGAEATSASGSTTDACPAATTCNASYTVYSETLSGTTYGAPVNVGTVYVVGSTYTGTGVATNGHNGAPNATSNGGVTPVSSPELIDTQHISAGTKYVYYVVPTASTAGTPSCTTTFCEDGSGLSGPASAASAPVTAGSGAVSPAIESIDVVPSNSLAVSSNAGTYTSGTVGGLTVTYNENVSCLSAAGADFKYSNSGSGSAPGAVTGSTCAQAGGAPVGTTNQLQIWFPPSYCSSACTTATPVYSPNVVDPPGNGDNVVYTPPSPNTTSNAVYAGTSGSPSYEASQTVTDTASPTATTNTGTLTSPTNPLFAQPIMLSAAHTPGPPGTLAIVYNETVVCPTTMTTAQYSGAAIGANTTAPVCGAVNSGSSGQQTTTITLTYPLATAAGTLTYTANANPTAVNSVNNGYSTNEYAPTQSITAT